MSMASMSREKNWKLEVGNLPRHPILKTLHHQVRFQQNWTVWATMDKPKRAQNAMPVLFWGMYP